MNARDEPLASACFTREHRNQQGGSLASQLG